MKHALDFFSPKGLFDFDTNFFDWFGDFTPKYFTNSPKVNVKETDKAYEIEIANPGFNKDDTTIKIENGVLSVSMSSESKEGEGTDKYHVKQWNKSSYKESWNLPENVIEDEINAKHVDGVLTITLPKKEETKETEKSRTITIQ